jgi:hypothetical protein
VAPGPLELRGRHHRLRLGRPDHDPVHAPQSSPVTGKSFNYAPVAVLVVLGFPGTYWLVSARKWFTGPKVQGPAEELAEIERDLTI